MKINPPVYENLVQLRVGYFVQTLNNGLRICVVRTEDCTEVPTSSTRFFVSVPDSLYVMYVPTLPKNGFYEDHTMSIVILCTL
jgi:hypothetical protein